MNNHTRPHVARKRFGQHFLRDSHVLERIINAFAPRDDQNLVEIGPGLGALTFPLLERVKQLTVIELDRDLAERLRQKFPPDRLTIRQMDVLNCTLSDIERHHADHGLRLIGNLPYNISTPLIFHLLAQRQCIEDMVFMVQREVALRLAAEPGSKQYGRLSVMAALSLESDYLFDVPPEAFDPPPRVDSTVIRLVPRSDGIDAGTIPAISKIVSAAFGQRRKTLRNSLAGLIDQPLFEAAGIEPSLRAEALTPAQFVSLAEHYDAQSGSLG